MSREHIITKAMYLDNEITVSGMPWCADEPKTVVMVSLTAKILCVAHNSALSEVDQEAVCFAEAMRESFRLLQVRIGRNDHRWRIVRFPVDGRRLERWFLKTLINAAYDRGSPISHIRARETPVPVSAGACVLMHIIPVNSIGNSRRYDVIHLKSDLGFHRTLAPLFTDFGSNLRFNFDGLLVYHSTRDKVSPGFTQLYRSGIVESMDSLFLSSTDQFGRPKVIPSQSFESRIFRNVVRYLSVLKSLDVDLPVLLTVCLIDVRGYALSLDYESTDQFDRDIVLPQEVMIETYDVDLPLVMKPLLDEIWNAAGREGSPYYSGDKWTGDRQRF